MNKTMHNSENPRPNKFNYAQVARPSYPRNTVQPQQQQRVEGANDLQADLKKPSFTSPTTQGHGSYKKNYSSSYKSKENNTYNNFKKAGVQLPMAPPTETSHIQFGSINQNPNIPVNSTGGSNKTGDIPVLREVQFGSLPATDATLHRPQTRSQQQQQLKTEIPRSTRATNDARLFTQAYAPRREFNQGDFSNNNSNNNNNNRYYNNRHNGNNKNGYVKTPNGLSQNAHYHNSSNPPIASYQQYSAPQTHAQSQPAPSQTSTQKSPLIQPATSDSSAYHLSPKIQQSPLLQQQPPQQNSPPVYTSPNSNYTKKAISPNMSHSSPQSIPVNSSSYGYVPYYPAYGVPVPSYNSLPAHNRGYVPPANVKKPLSIVNPNTGAKLDTTQVSLATVPVPTKQEKFEFKIPQPNVSKRVLIVDPATRDKELREKREREEAELEAKRKAEEERLEQERKAAEEKERLEREQKEREEQERLEKERLEREEKERLEREEREEKERQEKEEKERLEKERLALLEAEVQKKRTEEEAQRKAEEEQELKRIKSELEAKKRKDEQERGRSTPKTMQLISDPNAITYPSTVENPPSKVNGRFTYSVEFLKLFSALCIDKSTELAKWDETLDGAIDRKGSGPTAPRDKSGSHRGQSGSGSTFRVGSRDGRMEMGKFNTGRTLNPRNNSTPGVFMERQGSSNGRGGSVGGRGGRGGMKVIRHPSQQQNAPIILNEPVVPLEKSENRWIPATLAQTKQQEVSEDGLLPEEVIIKKVKALLNKLTIEKFDPISAKIFEYARQSEKENNGKALQTVLKLTFEKACDEPAFASMWASLCRRMCYSMTNDIRDEYLLDEQGKPSFGVLLFRRYLFNRCQEEFEKGWKMDMPVVEEGEMLTEEYYAAVKAKRQGLGLIQLIGELFKLEMLSERIMYGCLIKLCNDPSNAGDEEAESLCKLLTTIGKKLDSKPKTSRWIDIVIGRMKNEMVTSAKMSSRMKFMIQDVLDLRKQNWVPRNASSQVGPTTLAKIHEMAEKDKEQKEAATAKRGNSNRGPYIPNQYNNNVQRTGSYRGGRDHFQPHNNNSGNNNNNNNNSSSNNNVVDGWNTVGASSPIAEKSPTNDLSNFGKPLRGRSKNNILGPSNSPFPSLARNKAATESKNAGDGRSSPAVNMFSALLSDGDESEEHKKVQQSPETSPSETNTSSEKLSDDVVRRKSKNIIDEYFNLRDKKELSECIKELDDPHYLELFAQETLTVVEKKSEDVDTMCDVVSYIIAEKLIEKQTYINAFKTFMEGYDDLTIDVPQAPKYVSKLLEASTIDSSDEGTEDIFSHLS
ncbi:hypothetical protein BY458DRAFT_458095 [Sporodiniella umbellata]|nr:hypothetical protein BY458DRAFT_458095 [Sporodiniella umbellata]